MRAFCVAVTSATLFTMAWYHASGAPILIVGTLWLWANWGEPPGFWLHLSRRYKQRAERRSDRRAGLYDDDD